MEKKRIDIVCERIIYLIEKNRRVNSVLFLEYMRLRNEVEKEYKLKIEEDEEIQERIEMFFFWKQWRKEHPDFMKLQNQS